MRFAIIGCGVIAPVHAGAISALGTGHELVAVVDSDPERAQAFTAEHGGVPGTDLAAVLARGDVDAVAVCTPSGTHVDIAVAALEAGKHVVVEKPVDVSVAAADRLLSAERAAGRTVTVISQHRFDAASQTVHAAAADGRLGRLTSGVASIAWWRTQGYYDSGDWRGTWALDGGGALMNQGVHTVDLLVWVMGQPVEVSAQTGLLAHAGIEVEDVAVATVRFASGALGVLHGTTAAYPGLSARVQVHGDSGSAIIDDDRLAWFHTRSASSVEADAYGGSLSDNQVEQALAAAVAGEHGPTAGADPGPLGAAHQAQYADFVDAVATGRPPRVTVAAARRTVATITAAYASARTGRPVAID